MTENDPTTIHSLATCRADPQTGKRPELVALPPDFCSGVFVQLHEMTKSQACADDCISLGPCIEALYQPRNTVMKVRDAIKLIEKDGWFLVAQHGSHRQCKHPVKKGRVTIPGKTSKDIAAGTLNSILKQAGLK
jgi:predicted RNA binding protein YcfA (HicA-like mRNA interferase family)